MIWWRTPVHATWHFTVLCFGVIGGVAFARWCPNVAWEWLIIALAMVGFVVYRPWRICLVVMIIAGSIIGLVRGGVEQRQQLIYKDFFGKSLQITGVVQDDPEQQSSSRTTVQLRDVVLAEKSMPGVVWASIIGRIHDARRGDRITIVGKMDAGFGSFAAVLRSGKIKRIEHPQPGDVALQMRDWFAANISQVVDGQAASLGSGFLLGQKRALPHDTQEALRTVGLTHIIVASGYNLTILVRLTRRLFAKISRYTAVVSGVALVLGFISVTGLSPSMVRAGMVSLLSLWAWMYGRSFHPVTLLSFVGAATVLYAPYYVWGDVGWMLSFASFAGVMILAPLLQRYFFGEVKPSTIRQVVGETLAAQMMTLPISILVFGQMSLIALVANVLIVPFVPFAMVLTFLAGIGGAMPMVLSFLGVPAQWLLDMMLWVVDWCAALPWASIDITLPWWVIWLWYGGLAILCWWLQKTTQYKLRQSSVVE